jgi:hypothetical protein
MHYLKVPKPRVKHVVQLFRALLKIGINSNSCFYKCKYSQVYKILSLNKVLQVVSAPADP